MTDISTVRSNRRTLAITVGCDGTVTVRAPLHTPDGIIERFVEENRAWIEKAILKNAEYAASHPEPTEEEKGRLLKAAREILPEKVLYYENLMGLHPASVTVTGAKTRFGSCSGKNSVCFSWRLMQYPDEAIDYVVIHELAHIKHHNHGKRFWALVEKYCPDYKNRRALLKK